MNIHEVEEKKKIKNKKDRSGFVLIKPITEDFMILKGGRVPELLWLPTAPLKMSLGCGVHPSHGTVGAVPGAPGRGRTCPRRCPRRGGALGAHFTQLDGNLSLFGHSGGSGSV